MKKTKPDTREAALARGRKAIEGCQLLQNIESKIKNDREYLVQKYGPNFDKPAHSFGLNVAECAVIDEWLNSLVPEILAIQKKSGAGDLIDGGTPYYGAIGGGVSYNFTPTGLGTIITVTEITTGKTLNVNEATRWYFFG